MNIQRVIDAVRVAPGRPAGLDRRDTDWRDEPELRDLTDEELKGRSRAVVDAALDTLSDLQERLWADNRRSVLIVLQGMDAAGKDSAIKHIMSGVNPQGCAVVPFKKPSAEELDHSFLWRAMGAAPERGKIVIFNRSHYEEVLVVRVHPEILDQRQLLDGPRDGSFWSARYEDINAFERHLARTGTLVLKFFLHLSKDEQRNRLLARLDNPDKRWKFSLGDLDERERWDDYAAAYEAALSATSTDWAPWHVVPADHKWVARAIISAIIGHEMAKLDLRFPQPDPELMGSLDDARRRLKES